jgi:hypothetical protein
MDGLSELQKGSKLLHVVEGWLREEKAERRRRQTSGAQQAAAAPLRPSHPHMPSKHLAFFR